MNNDLKQGFARNLKFAESNAVLSLSLSLLIENFSSYCAIARACIIHAFSFIQILITRIYRACLAHTFDPKIALIRKVG